MLQLVFAGAAGKIDAQDTDVVLGAGAAYAGRLTVVLLNPLADLVVVGGGG